MTYSSGFDLWQFGRANQCTREDVGNGQSAQHCSHGTDSSPTVQHHPSSGICFSPNVTPGTVTGKDCRHGSDGAQHSMVIPKGEDNGLKHENASSTGLSFRTKQQQHQQPPSNHQHHDSHVPTEPLVRSEDSARRSLERARPPMAVAAGNVPRQRCNI